MKILLTGSHGFIGRNLAEKLQGDYEVHAPGRMELDLLDHQAVEAFLGRHQFDIVIHAANVNSTRNVVVKLFCNICG